MYLLTSMYFGLERKLDLFDGVITGLLLIWPLVQRSHGDCRKENYVVRPACVQGSQSGNSWRSYGGLVTYSLGLREDVRSKLSCVDDGDGASWEERSSSDDTDVNRVYCYNFSHKTCHNKSEWLQSVEPYQNCVLPLLLRVLWRHVLISLSYDFHCLPIDSSVNECRPNRARILYTQQTGTSNQVLKRIELSARLGNGRRKAKNRLRAFAASCYRKLNNKVRTNHTCIGIKIQHFKISISFVKCTSYGITILFLFLLNIRKTLWIICLQFYYILLYDILLYFISPPRLAMSMGLYRVLSALLLKLACNK